MKSSFNMIIYCYVLMNRECEKIWKYVFAWIAVPSLFYCSFRILMPMFTMHIKLEVAKYMNTGRIFYSRLENKLKKWFEMNFETGLH